MATAEVLDIERLVAPIEGDTGTGDDLRESGSANYQELKDARRSIASLSRAKKFDAQSDNEIDELWQLIFKKAPEVLVSEAKDLEVAAWLAEAALRIHGFAGLRDGFKIVHRLTESFWDHLHPMPDEDGLETRVYPITGLNGEDGRGTLILPIRNVPLSDDYDGAFTYNLYDRCNEATKLKDPDAQRQRFDDIGTNLVDIQNQVDGGSIPFYQTLLEDVDGCIEAFTASSQLLDEKCGYQFAPPSSGIKESLVKVQDALKHLTQNKFPKEVPVEESTQSEETSEAVAATPTSQGGQSVAVGAIGSRDDAINHLLLVADYFRKTEPHSPVCGALERVVRWGRMPFQDLMAELIQDANSRANFAQLTGIQLGDDAEPIGGLASTAKPAAVAEAPVVSEPEPATDTGTSDSSGGW